ncbi:MlaD family protein [Phyllobacterium sp. TAF24]|uniref:MlaD family protein n=1 Tax=unclassified Phyllobacterium TaxID=2638441 RepID=UPI00088CF9E5|nr:MlaD family protein [Phyllobacterium sp. OV277]SDO71000.1 ABC-type transporter Mla maintaining outer membrane lipid asymmetry, component MlaD [Phyllobacterium sp. OV277]
METKANYLVVSIFTVLVSVLALGFVYWIERLGDTRPTSMLEIRIPGSVTGLVVKSQVLFNGLKVGEVTRLFIDASNPDVVIAQTEIDSTTPITRSTQAELAFVMLTGQAYIELKGGKSYEPKLLEEAEKEDTVARIDIDPSSLKTLVQTVQDVLQKVDRAMDATESYLDEMKGPALDRAHEAKDFTQQLADSTEMINRYGQRAQDVQAVIKDARETMSRINEASVKVDDALTRLDKELSEDKGGTVANIREQLQSYRDTADGLQARLAPIMKTLGTYTGEKLRNAQKFISDSRRSVESIERAISNFDSNPQELLFGGENKVPEYNGRR